MQNYMNLIFDIIEGDTPKAKYEELRRLIAVDEAAKAKEIDPDDWAGHATRHEDSYNFEKYNDKDNE